jgi:hypothetical protein
MSDTSSMLVAVLLTGAVCSVVAGLAVLRRDPDTVRAWRHSLRRWRRRRRW